MLGECWILNTGRPDGLQIFAAGDETAFGKGFDHAGQLVSGGGKVRIMAKAIQRRRFCNPGLLWIQLPGMQVKQVGVLLCQNALDTFFENREGDQAEVAAAAPG